MEPFTAPWTYEYNKNDEGKSLGTKKATTYQQSILYVVLQHYLTTLIVREVV